MLLNYLRRQVYVQLVLVRFEAGMIKLRRNGFNDDERVKLMGLSISRNIVLAAIVLLSACAPNPDQQTPSDQGEANNSEEHHSTENYLGAEAWPAGQSPLVPNPAMEKAIRALIARMTIEEKVGQLIQGEIKDTTPEDVKKYHLGSVLNGGGSMPNRNKHATPQEWLDLADAYYEASMDTSDGKSAIPLIWGSDAVHGHNNVIGATVFPHNIGLGATHNPALLREIGNVTARETRVTGIDWTFAPTLAVVQNDRWGRTYESYSEDPALVKAYAKEMVYGLQGVPGTKEFLDANHVVATAKHFLGDGGTENGEDQGNAKISENELRDIHGAGYAPAISAGVQTAMASFSSWNGEKLHGSRYLLTDVLKVQLGLDGFIVGDWNGHGQLPGCTNASCAASINAGVDMIMVPTDWKEFYTNTVAQVRAGDITMARLNDAVGRILRVKMRAGLFDKGRPSERGIAGKPNIIGSKAHREVARRAVRQSLVLLKNNNGLLPLKAGQNILVTGDGANDIGKQSGGWTITWQGTGNVNSDFPGGTSIYDGLKDAVLATGSTVELSVDGAYTTKPDVAVVVFGEDPYAEFQGDRETLEFEPVQKTSLKLLQKLRAENIPVVSVFLSGRPMWVNPEINASDAFVAAWLPGSEGVGVADVLVADKQNQPRFDFKGTLSFSWPKTPLQDVLNPHHRDYDPLFGLGYGLTYTSANDQSPILPEDVEGVAKAGADSFPIYFGRPQAPWQVWVSDEQSTILLSGAYASLPSQAAVVTTTDMNVQEDALKVAWAGDKKATMFIQADGPETHYDFSTILEAGGTIRFDVNVEKALSGNMFLQMKCGENCERSLDISSQLNQLAGKGWRPLALKLGCFATNDDTFEKINRPFALQASDAGTISIANIKVSKQADTTHNCQ